MSLLYEAIGNCFYLINSFRGAVALYGKGSNGKSTLLNIIIQLLGPENVSALSLQDTAERFRLSQIYGKAANVGDDISGAYLPDTSTFKKLVTGEYVTAEKKGQDPFQFRSFAKIFFAMNELPRANDKSKGFFGRLLIVPLTQDFSQNGKRDVGMKDRTWTRAEMEYLTRLAVEGLKRLIQQGDFTRPQSVVDAVAVYEAENNPVKMFLEEYGESFGSIEGRPREVVYSEYCFWCVKNGFKTGSATSFSREIHNLTGMVTKPRRLPHSGGKVVRCFCQ